MKWVKTILVFSILGLGFLYGQIYVYFSKSIDSDYARGVEAFGNVPLDSVAAHLVSMADYSIDFCFYNLLSEKVVDSLIAAHNRGVKIRVITEANHRDNWSFVELENHGIPVIDDTTGPNSGYGYMHNKFMVIDFRDSTDTNDDWILTGSHNLQDPDWGENYIVIRSHSLARAYTMEFEEMWGSHSDYPNPSNCRFGTRKTDNTPHYFVVDGIPMELYFSPSDNALSHVIDAVRTADYEIDFCIFAFTRQDLCDTMRNRWDEGVMVQGVFDRADWLGPYSKSRDMTGLSGHVWVPPAPVYCDSLPETLHHKYMVIDAQYPNSDPILITGSMNWSNRGNNTNDENTLIIHDYRIANLYLQEFVARYEEAGGDYQGYKVGDVNASGSVTSSDLIYLANYMFSGGNEPMPLWSADINGDAKVSPADIVLLSHKIYGRAK